MKRISLVVLVISLAASIVLVSCANYRHRTWRDGDQSADAGPGYSLRFIESDDEGWFWDPEQAMDSIELIRSKIRERDTMVVMFVHGWQHSAECCDGNMEGFRRALLKLNESLNKPPGESPGRHRFNIVGIYVGWRGRSLPGFFNYFTFWGRKGAAERIGQNDLKEYLARLQDLYVEYRPDVLSRQEMVLPPETDTQPDKRFLGLVILGHSFGAQVLLRAVSSSLEDRLQHLNKNPAYLRDAQPVAPDPTRKHSLSGVGDLMVLINPAAEASQYHRLHILS